MIPATLKSRANTNASIVQGVWISENPNQARSLLVGKGQRSIIIKTLIPKSKYKSDTPLRGPVISNPVGKREGRDKETGDRKTNLTPKS